MEAKLSLVRRERAWPVRVKGSRFPALATMEALLMLGDLPRGDCVAVRTCGMQCWTSIVLSWMLRAWSSFSCFSPRMR